MSKKYKLNIYSFSILLMFIMVEAQGLPENFVYLKDIDSTIVQQIRYFSDHNFTGKRLAGYEASECILTKQAAKALADVQKVLLKSNLSLQVYDCYRPQQSVNDFVIWGKRLDDQKMKQEFYPRINKADAFKDGYVAEKSSHTRGSTVDLTIIPVGAKSKAYHDGQSLISCYAPYSERFDDGSIDMGTGFDCFDVLAHNDNRSINQTAYQNRLLLKSLMEQHGFNPYQPEWWHFTLKNEPYPNTYFDFLIK